MTVLRVLLVVLLVVALAVPTGVVARPTADSEATADDTIDATYVVSHNVSAPRIEVSLDHSIPSQVTELTIRPPPGVSVHSTDGFTATDEGYAWDGETASPSIRYTVPETTGRTLVTSAYAYTDTGTFGVGASWRYRGDAVRYERTITLDGEGAVRGPAVGLWQNATQVETADGTTISVVRPPVSGEDAVGAQPPLAAVAEQLAAVDNFFSFDRGDDHLVVYLRPTEAPELEGNIGGRANSAGRILLEAESATDTGLVAHEWVHTQQDFRTEAPTNWLVEGSADYYAAYYRYHAGDLSFEELRTQLTVRGTEYADTNLRELTNASEPGDYRKGRHVAGGLDAWIRDRSAGSARLGSVLVALRERDGGNPRLADGQAVGTTGFVATVDGVSDSTVEFWYDAATGPSSPPELPTNSAVYAHGSTTATATSTTSATPTTTTSPTPTPAPTVTDTETATVTAPPPTEALGQPGFGPLAVVVAALVVTAWTRRRA